MRPVHKSDRKVSAWEIAAFAAPAGPLLALGLPTIMFLPQYYIRDLGIEAGAVIFVITRLLDVVIDPMIGGWHDRTITKWGRRRFWLAVSCPILVLFVWWAFLGLTPTSGFVAALIAVLALFSSFASIMIAHLGWAGELIPTYEGRTRVLGMVQIMGLAGQVGVLAVAAFAQSQGANVVHAIGWYIIIGAPIAVLFTLAFVRERQLPPQSHLTLRQAAAAVLRNRFARRVLGVDLMLGIAQGVAGTLFIFYFEYVLRFEQQSSLLLFLYFVAGLLGTPLWIYAGRRWGKHRALQANFLWAIVTTAMLPLVPPGNLPICIAFMMLAGMSQGGGILLTRALMADVVDEDELQTGARRSGLYFGLLLTTSKIAIVAGPLSLALLQLVGFDPQAGAVNPPAMLLALGAMFVLGPVIPQAIGIWLLKDYPLDEEAQAALAAAIEARHAAEDVKATLDAVVK